MPRKIKIFPKSPPAWGGKSIAHESDRIGQQRNAPTPTVSKKLIFPILEFNDQNTFGPQTLLHTYF